MRRIIIPPSKIQTYNHLINSRLLCYWATEEQQEIKSHKVQTIIVFVNCDEVTGY